jgi:hypothetical protein
MRKLFVVLLTGMYLICFSLSVQAEEKNLVNTRLPTIKELETWSYTFYQTMEAEPGTEDLSGPGFTKNPLIQTYVFKAPANSNLKEILVGIAKGNDGIIYAFAMGCWWKGEKEPVSCNYDWPQKWTMAMNE